MNTYVPPTLVIALGGNALLRRGQPLTAAAQRAQIEIAARDIAPLLGTHRVAITHGNGPQVGLLSIQAGGTWPLDVLDAQSEGMIGYEIELALANAAPNAKLATLLTQVEVSLEDPAFGNPTKPIGPVYSKPVLQDFPDWTLKSDGTGWRRVVPSPLPQRILGVETLRLLIDAGVHTICLGGGGIPVARALDGALDGVEAVIDKDAASAMLALELCADVLIMLTDVPAVMADFGTPQARAIGATTPRKLSQFDFPAGTMGPKVAAAVAMAKAGRSAAIGALGDLEAILRGDTGTWVCPDAD
jgi:carbamate kinase